MYWIATLMLSRSPRSVIGASGSHLIRSAALDLHVLALLRRDLVRPGHQPVEDLLGDRHEPRVRDPGAVVAVGRLALLVRLHLGEGLGVGGLVVLDRDLRRHAAHRVDVAAVAGLDQQLGVALHEVRGHRHQRAVGEAELVVVPELLDAREDVVPAAAVEARRVLAQLVQDLVHLERREQRLDQHRRLDRALRDAQLVLRHHEDVVPQPRLEVALELRQVEVRARAARQQLLRVVEEIEREVEDAARDLRAVDQHVLFRQVPAARAHEQHGGLLGEPVALALRRRRSRCGGGSRRAG